MPRSSYLPNTQDGKVAWGQTFKDVVGPKIAVYGISQSAMTVFGVAADLALSCLQTAKNPLTRTKANIAAKNEAIAQMAKLAANLVGTIQSNPEVSTQMKLEAGLTVRKTKPTRKDAPSDQPVVTVAAVNGRTATIKLGGGTSKRARPENVASATILTSESETEPMVLSDYQFSTVTSLTTVDVPFGPSETGSVVWVAAMWTNARGSGPVSDPVQVRLPPGGQVRSAGQSRMRIAKAA